ncbi:MAG TPA: hypothetical protein DIU00_14105 [Phycisphaerales bacterium]|nr:hypothetical protein [Phycisphaerales bacterium]
MSIKKIVILLAVVLSLILLLGSIDPRPQIYDPNVVHGFQPKSNSRERTLEYKVVVASDPNTLETKVTQRLKDQKDNWIPIGGISVDDTNCYQAMVRVNE